MKTIFIVSLLLLIILCIIFHCSIFISENFHSDTDIENDTNNIIIYIHICQKDEWKRSLSILLNSIKESSLYDAANEIRLGVVNEEGTLDEENLDLTGKYKLVYTGKNNEYERPTLLHMKKSSTTDPENTLYCYLHTKGIRHFNTNNEKPILDWINNMLDCNIYDWKNVVNKLKTHETYGCNYNGLHYSGNFWWATIEHIKKLPDVIPSDYIAPENWVLVNKDNLFCGKNCEPNYVPPFPSNIYG